MPSAGRILIMPKGKWNQETTYEMLDLVERNGVSWIARRTSKGVVPSTDNNEDWQAVSRMMSVDSGTIQVNCSSGETEYTINIGHVDDTIYGVMHWLGEPISWDFKKANLYQKDNTSGTISTDKENTFKVHYMVFYKDRI